MSKLLALCLLACCASCAMLKPGINGTTEVVYQGTADGAARLLAEQNRARQTADAGDIAKEAVRQGKPATLGQDANRSDVQAGYAFPWMTAMYGGAFMGGSPVAMYGDAATAGYVPGRLPQVGYPPVGYVQSQPQVVVQAAGAGSGGTASDEIVECPKTRKAKTTAELAACTANNVKELFRATRK